QHRHGLSQIDDVNVVARTKDEGSHLRIPAMALVAEVAAGFEQLTHIEGGKRHGCFVLFRLSLRATREDRLCPCHLHCVPRASRPTGALGGVFDPPSAGLACGMVRCLISDGTIYKRLRRSQPPPGGRGVRARGSIPTGRPWPGSHEAFALAALAARACVVSDGAPGSFRGRLAMTLEPNLPLLRPVLQPERAALVISPRRCAAGAPGAPAKTRKALARRHRRLANRQGSQPPNHRAPCACPQADPNEELAPSNMTASAKGTAEKAGRNVKAKAGLNRAILDATPGSFLTKAERSWVRADRLEYPQGEAVPDVPLLRDRSQESLG